METPESFASTALAGFRAVHAQTVRPVPGGAVRARAGAKGKLALVVGGGSGHHPAFLGYVGHGFADGAIGVARAIERGGGGVIAFGNYAGDVLNLGLAAERLTAAGIRATCLLVTDDVASAPPDRRALRRGVAGDLPVFRIAGAAAEGGLGFDAVVRVGRLANERTFSFGVAFDACRLPGAGEPLFTVPAGRMAIGLGAAWAEAADAASKAAEATAALTPRLGRARPLAARSLGYHPDAGATSLALCAKALVPLFAECRP